MRKFKYPDERLIVFILLGLLFIFFLVVSLLQEGTYGGADDISHYNISSNAFKYPHLILNLWGKPLFTLLTAPFARFGLEGTIIFNIITGLLTCYFTYLIARIMQYKDTWLSILFICFAPMYTIMILTGMTEILFGFALVLSAYLFFKEKYIISAIVVSFLMFIRNEGIIIIPIYLIAYVCYKKWKAIPFLISGILLFSLIGTLYYHDFFWIIHYWPYGDTSGIYGSGSIFFYISNAPRIIGIPLIILFIPGLLYNLIRFFSKFSLKPSRQLAEFLLILGPLFMLLAGHSYAWYKGTVGSGGLIRFMTSILPLAALYCLQGINLITKPRFVNKWIKTGIFAVLLYYVFITPFKIYAIPRRFNEPERLVYKASQWLKQNALDKGKIYFFDPLLQYHLGVNYFDHDRIFQNLPKPDNPAENIPEGSFIAWDAHFGANEGRVSLESLINNPSLRLIKLFKPVDYFWVLGKNYYNIFIFRKDTTVAENYNFNQLGQLSFYNDDSFKQIKIIRSGNLDNDTLTNLPDTVLSDRACIILDTTETYSHTISIRGSEIEQMYSRIRASLLYYPVDPLMDGSCVLVLSILRGDKILLYHSTVPFFLYNRPGMWNLMITEALLPEGMDQENEIRIYIWQNKHQEIYVNDLKLELIY